MRRLAKAASAVSIIAVASVGVIACLGPTQLMLELRTDLPCASVKDVSITVGSSPASVESAKPGTTARSCSSDGTIGTIAVAPSGERNGRIAIRAVLGVDIPADQCTPDNQYSGCIVVRRELAFVPHQTLVVPIAFYAVCRNVACTGTSTCKGPEGCVDSSADLTPTTNPECKSAADCPAIQTKPEGCAEPICDSGKCAYLAKDADGDKDRAATCFATDAKIAVKVGSDCDDADPNINANAKRACGAAACGGFQTCENGAVGPCTATKTPTFDCNNGLDNDCNGIVDADELAPLAASDKTRLCANLYRCPKGNVQPDRLPLCRVGTGQYTLDCAAFANASVIGYVPVNGTDSPGAGAVFLYITNTRDLVYPYNVGSSCCANGLCGGSQLCTGSPLLCGATLLTPPL